MFEIDYIDAEDIERDGVDMLKTLDAILVPGGFGDRGIEGKIAAVQYARESGTPYLGICLGMHMAMIGFAHNVCGMAGAHSTEMDIDTPYPVIGLVPNGEPRQVKSSSATSIRIWAAP